MVRCRRISISIFYNIPRSDGEQMDGMVRKVATWISGEASDNTCEDNVLTRCILMQYRVDRIVSEMSKQQRIAPRSTRLL